MVATYFVHLFHLAVRSKQLRERLKFHNVFGFCCKNLLTNFARNLWKEMEISFWM